MIEKETDLPSGRRGQVYYSLPAPGDADADGMPDFWEAQYGLDGRSSADNTRDADGDGYVNLEEYLNNTVPRGVVKPVVYVAAADPRAYEGDAKAGEFKVMRTGGMTADLVVHYTLGGTAANGSDYGKLTGTVVIPDGMSHAVIRIEPLRDGRMEGQEMVTIALAAGEEYFLGCPAKIHE